MIRRLDEVCTHVVDCKNRTAPIDPDGDYYAIGTPAMRGNVINYAEARRINAETFAEWTDRLMPQEGDILFAREAPVGPVVAIPPGGRAAAGQRTMLLRADPAQADSNYLRQYLSAPKTQARILSLAHGSTTPHLRVADVRSFPVELPSLAKQRAIAAVLGALDDKIASNTKLATKARGLAELEFRRLMAQAEQTTTVGGIMSLEYGKSLPTDRRTPGHVDVFGSGGIVGSHNEALCAGPGVIVGRKGTAGAVHWAPGPFFPIDTTFYVEPKVEEASQVFCYFLLKTLRLDEMNSDSAVPGLNRNEAYTAAVKRPATAAVQRFSERAGQFFSLASQTERDSKALAATRDTLLPQLMSGKLQAKDAEPLVSVAG